MCCIQTELVLHGQRQKYFSLQRIRQRYTGLTFHNSSKLGWSSRVFRVVLEHICTNVQYRWTMYMCMMYIYVCVFIFYSSC